MLATLDQVLLAHELPDEPPSFSTVSQKEWLRRKEVDRMLFSLADEVMPWNKDGCVGVFSDLHLCNYKIRGVTVIFHPHTVKGLYCVGPITLDMPTCKEDVIRAVDAVLVLQELGMKTKEGDCS